MKLIAYLKKENKCVRKEKAKVQAKLEVEQRKHKRVTDVHDSLMESIEYERDVTGRKQCNRENVKDRLFEAKAENALSMGKVRKAQEQYMEVAHQRLKLQKALAQVLTRVQTNVSDKSVVEDAVVTALRAESVGKSIMTALDVASGPDLTWSDVSDSESGSDFSDYF